MLDRIRNLFTGGKSTQPQAPVRVVDNPQANVPARWRQQLGPGWPVSPTLFPTERDKIAANEPKAFAPLPNINATLTPRAGYGLMPFSELKGWAQAVPEVALCVRLITEELKSFTPVIKAADGTVVQKARSVTRRTPGGGLRKYILPANEFELNGVEWMTTSPDGQARWQNWLARAVWNTMVYDALCLHRLRDARGAVNGLRVIDGSTIFTIIDEQAGTPAPPAPAFQQIILGFPRGNYTTLDLWYEPRRQRPDAPYGVSFIEDSLSAVKFLAQWWSWQTAWYTAGSNPARDYSAPPGWTQQQIMDYMDALNQVYSGSPENRQKAHIFPNGMSLLADRTQTATGAAGADPARQAAFEIVAFHAGIPPSELGKAPGEGLGGTGYAEAGQSIFYRMGLAPIIAHLKAPFDETLDWLGYPGYSWELDFPEESIDPDAEEQKHLKRWEVGIATRDETREQMGLPAVGGEPGAEFASGLAAGGAGLGAPGAPNAGGISADIPGAPGWANETLPVVGGPARGVRGVVTQTLLMGTAGAPDDDPHAARKAQDERRLRAALLDYFDEFEGRLLEAVEAGAEGAPAAQVLPIAKTAAWSGLLVRADGELRKHPGHPDQKVHGNDEGKTDDKDVVGFSFFRGRLKNVGEARQLGESPEGWAKHETKFKDEYLDRFGLKDEIERTIGLWDGPEPSFNAWVEGDPEQVMAMAKAWGAAHNQEGMAILLPKPDGKGGKLAWDLDGPASDEDLNSLLNGLAEAKAMYKADYGKDFPLGLTVREGRTSFEYWYGDGQAAQDAELLVNLALTKTAFRATARAPEGGYEFRLLEQGVDY